MHGTRGERHHHLAMVVVEDGDGADGWKRRAIGKEKEKRRNGREAQAESQRVEKKLVSSIQSHKMVLG